MQIEQTYSAEFISTPRNSTDVVQKKSGNPGYIAGLPLLVGQPDPNNPGAFLVYQDGFKISGVNSLGGCMTSPKPQSTYLAEMGDPVLNFGEDLVVGCTVSFTQQQLANACT